MHTRKPSAKDGQWTNSWCIVEFGVLCEQFPISQAPKRVSFYALRDDVGGGVWLKTQAQKKFARKQSVLKQTVATIGASDACLWGCSAWESHKRWALWEWELWHLAIVQPLSHCGAVSPCGQLEANAVKVPTRRTPAEQKSPGRRPKATGADNQRHQPQVEWHRKSNHNLKGIVKMSMDWWAVLHNQNPEKPKKD